jgi:hypothetical protein
MAAFGCGLIQSDRPHRAEIKGRDSPPDIVFNNPPQPLIGDAHEARSCQHRHFAHQDQGGLLEQQREPTARPRPRHRCPLDPVIRAIHPRHTRRNEAVVLEEVQMLPGETVEVVGPTGALAVRAGEKRPTIRDDFKVQFMRLLCDIQPLPGKFPRRFQAKPKGQNVPSFHRPTSHAETNPA